MTAKFTESQHCVERRACATCRLSPAWRLRFHAPEVCPFGVTSESAPKIVSERFYGAAQRDAVEQSASHAPPSLVTSGPGSHLKRLLSRVGLRASPNCKCNQRAKYMDQMGVEWCRQNIETICGWLQEEASTRKLPFVQSAARALVSLSISRAERDLRDMPQKASTKT